MDLLALLFLKYLSFIFVDSSTNTPYNIGPFPVKVDYIIINKKNLDANILLIVIFTVMQGKHTWNNSPPQKKKKSKVYSQLASYSFLLHSLYIYSTLFLIMLKQNLSWIFCIFFQIDFCKWPERENLLIQVLHFSFLSSPSLVLTTHSISFLSIISFMTAVLVLIYLLNTSLLDFTAFSFRF